MTFIKKKKNSLSVYKLSGYYTEIRDERHRNRENTPSFV